MPQSAEYEPGRGAQSSAKGLSCIVCAYNEVSRIQNILDVIVGHPDLTEVLVVNDGSTDDTEALVRGYAGVKAISYAANRGKTYALSRGVAEAQCEHLMLLDADLAGLTVEDVTALALPVMSGRADVSLSLRCNSLWIYRRLGLDFVTGERVIPASLLRDAATAMERMPRWAGEAYINEMIIQRALRIAVVDWPGVRNVRKFEKAGWWPGLLAEIAMIRDAVDVLTPWGVVRQNLALRQLTVRAAQGRPRRTTLMPAAFSWRRA